MEPVGPTKPCGHHWPEHSVCPGDEVNRPGGHRTQVAFAEGIWPAGHDKVQALEPGGEVELPAHAVHEVPPADVLPIGPKVFAGHMVPWQDVAPDVDEN